MSRYDARSDQPFKFTEFLFGCVETLSQPSLLRPTKLRLLKRSFLILVYDVDHLYLDLDNRIVCFSDLPSELFLLFKGKLIGHNGFDKLSCFWCIWIQRYLMRPSFNWLCWELL